MAYCIQEFLIIMTNTNSSLTNAFATNNKSVTVQSSRGKLV